MGKASDALSNLDPTSDDNVWSDIDPTTGGGALNLIGAPVTLPINAISGGNVGGSVSDSLAQLDDQISGRAQQDALDDAAEDAAAKQQEITDLYAEQYQGFLEMTAPYRKAGESFLPEFQNLISGAGREEFMQDALQSQEFQNIAGAATDQLVSNSAALGNRLSSGIQRDVLSNTGQLATNYANQAYQNRLNELGQGVNLGLGAMGTQLQGLQNTTAGQAGALNNIANINLQAANAAAMQPNLLGGLLGAGVGALIPGAGAAGANIGYNIGSNV